MAGDALRVVVRCDEYAPRLAREALERLPAPPETRSDARTVASELVTNAVLHSGCTPQDAIDVVAQCCEDCLRIEVFDPGRSARRARIERRAAGLGGMGLQVVDKLARRWGAGPAGGSYRVWAELALG